MRLVKIKINQWTKRLVCHRFLPIDRYNRYLSNQIYRYRQFTYGLILLFSVPSILMMIKLITTIVVFQLLQQCTQSKDTPCASLDLKEEVLEQSFSILSEKMIQRLEANLHPLHIRQQVAFSEEMLTRFTERSPTVRLYLQAFKLVKQGSEVLYKSNFSNERGISLIAHGYLTENSILQAFPVNSLGYLNFARRAYKGIFSFTKVSFFHTLCIILGNTFLRTATQLISRKSFA